jgi:hypothetical protein
MTLELVEKQQVNPQDITNQVIFSALHDRASPQYFRFQK